jgi:hypothetical protein
MWYKLSFMFPSVWHLTFTSCMLHYCRNACNPAGWAVHCFFTNIITPTKFCCLPYSIGRCKIPSSQTIKVKNYFSVRVMLKMHIQILKFYITQCSQKFYISILQHSYNLNTDWKWFTWSSLGSELYFCNTVYKGYKMQAAVCAFTV